MVEYVVLQNSSNEGTHNAHPFIGFIVAVGATVQPIMAAFRPHPGTPKFVQPVHESGSDLMDDFV